MVFKISMNTVKLLYPPLKYKTAHKFPKILFLHGHVEYMGPMVDRYTLIPTDKVNFGKRVVMQCLPEYITRDGKNQVPSLYIWQLFSNCSGSGFGTQMLDCARKLSKQIGCQGNIHVTADGCYNPHKIPHIFYRKYGMNTKIAKVDKKLDKFIAKGKNATYRDFNSVEMFYPPIIHEHSKFVKFLNAIKKKFLGW